MSYGLLIDDKGKCWPEIHPGLSRALQTERTGASLSSFAVRNLGFVRILPRKATVIFELNPLTVAAEAVTGAYYWFADSYLDRAVIEPVGAMEPAQILSTRSDVIGYLGFLMDRRTSRPDFIAVRLSTDNSQLGRRLSIAKDIMDAKLPVALKADLLTRMFDGRITVSEFDAGANEFRVVEVGDAMAHFMPGLRQRLLGNSYADALGGPYGAWVAKVVDAAGRIGEPVNEAVEAVIKIGPQRPRRIFYERLLVPSGNLASGACLLLTVTTAA